MTEPKPPLKRYQSDPYFRLPQDLLDQASKTDRPPPALAEAMVAAQDGPHAEDVTLVPCADCAGCLGCDDRHAVSRARRDLQIAARALPGSSSWAPGSPERAALERFHNRQASDADLLLMMAVELGNCLDALPPYAGPPADHLAHEVRPVDPMHASACALRARALVLALTARRPHPEDPPR